LLKFDGIFKIPIYYNIDQLSLLQVRYDTEEYRKYFKKVFENKTFRIYKLTV